MHAGQNVQQHNTCTHQHIATIAAGLTGLASRVHVPLLTPNQAPAAALSSTSCCMLLAHIETTYHAWQHAQPPAAHLGYSVLFVVVFVLFCSNLLFVFFVVVY
jgi:hypothetical protein